MSYPSNIDSPQGTTAAGTSLLATIDHALDHRTLGSAVVALENKLGVGSGSAAANQILVGTASGTSSWQQTWNNGTLGTATINSGVFGTPAIDVISARNSGTAVGFSNSMYPSEGTVVDAASGTLTVSAQAAQIYYCAMGTAAGNRTIGTPTNASSYQQLTYAFKASGSANGTLIWSGIFRFSQSLGTPTLGTGTTWNYYGWRYNAIDTKWDFMGQSLNII